MMSKKVSLFVVCIMLLVSFSMIQFSFDNASAVNYTWDNGQGTEVWEDGRNWGEALEADYPKTADDYGILNGYSNVNITSDLTVGRIDLGTGFFGNLNLSGGNVTLDDSGTKPGSLYVLGGNLTTNEYNMDIDGKLHIAGGNASFGNGTHTIRTTTDYAIKVQAGSIDCQGSYINTTSAYFEGGDVTLSNNTLEISSSISANEYSLMTETPSTFEHNNGLVKFTGTSAQGIYDLNNADRTLYDVEINCTGTVAYVIGYGYDLNVANNFTMVSGVFDSVEFDDDPAYDLICNNITMNGGVLKSRTGKIQIDEQLTMNGGTLGNDTAYELDINGNLDGSGGILNAPNDSGSFTWSGQYWRFNGTFNHDNGTLTSDRAGWQRLTKPLTFYNITSGSSASTGLKFQLQNIISGHFNIINNLTINSGKRVQLYGYGGQLSCFIDFGNDTHSGNLINNGFLYFGEGARGQIFLDAVNPNHPWYWKGSDAYSWGYAVSGYVWDNNYRFKNCIIEPDVATDGTGILINALGNMTFQGNVTLAENDEFRVRNASANILFEKNLTISGKFDSGKSNLTVIGNVSVLSNATFNDESIESDKTLNASQFSIEYRGDLTLRGEFFHNNGELRFVGNDLGTNLTESNIKNIGTPYDVEDNYIGHSAMDLDSNGHPYLTWTENMAGGYSNSSGAWKVRFMYYNGTSWSTPINITDTDHNHNTQDIFVTSPNDIDVYLISNGSNDVAYAPYGDLEKWHWNGTTWSYVNTILNETISGEGLALPAEVRNYDPEFRLLFMQAKFLEFTTDLKLYGLSETDTFVKNGSDDHFEDNGRGQSTYGTISYPQAMYHNGNTFVVYQGGPNPYNYYIKSYNHTTNTWSNRVKIGERLVADGHGAPTLIVRNDGRIVVFYDIHENLKLRISTNPGDITSWGDPIQPFPYLIYAKPFILPNGSIILFGLHGWGSDSKTLCYKISPDGCQNWSARINLTVLDKGNIPYVGKPIFDRTRNRIHFTFTKHDWVKSTTNYFREGVSHFYLDLTDYHIYTLGSVVQNLNASGKTFYNLSCSNNVEVKINENISVIGNIQCNGTFEITNGTVVTGNGTATVKNGHLEIINGSIYNFTYTDMGNTRADIYNSTNIKLHAWTTLPSASYTYTIGKGVRITEIGSNGRTDLRIYYSTSDVSGFVLSNLTILRYHSGAWNIVTSTHNTTGRYFQATNLTTFSYYIIGDVHLAYFEIIVPPDEWTLIGISRLLRTNYTASNQITQGLTNIVYRDSNGVYRSYVYEEGQYYGTDFSIDSYYGYWAFGVRETTLRFNIKAQTGVLSLPLTEGYNLRAIPPTTITTSWIITNNTDVKNIVVKRNGQFHSYTYITPDTQAFSFVDKEGIYIFADKVTTWVIT